MKKKFIRILAVLLCVTMGLTLSGCGDDVEEDVVIVDPEPDPVVEEDDQTITVVFYNGSGKEISAIDVESVNGDTEMVEITDGEGLEYEVSIRADIPYSEGLYRVHVYTEDGNLYDQEMDEATWDLNNYGLMVFPTEFAGDAMLYDGDEMDVFEAMDVANAALGIVVEDPEDQEQEKIADAVAKLGYKSLEEYREDNHDYLCTEDEEFETFPELIGYWYPNGDMNSKTYLSIDRNGGVTYWEFDYTKDVAVKYDSVKSALFSSYTMDSGTKFKVSWGNMTFDDSDVTYNRSDY